MSTGRSQPALQELFPELPPIAEAYRRRDFEALFGQIASCKDARLLEVPQAKPYPVAQLRLHPEDKHGTARGVQMQLAARLEMAKRAGARYRLERADAERFADDFFGSL